MSRRPDSCGLDRVFPKVFEKGRDMSKLETDVKSDTKMELRSVMH